jgi:hypothetical protein
LKVVVVLLCLQQGCKKFYRFLCECASRAKTSHYKKRDWPYLQSLDPGKQNVQHLPLEESNKILLSPLNIELGQGTCGKPTLVISEIWLQYVFKDAFSVFSHGLFFRKTVGVLSEEGGERFNREVSGMEKRYWESGFHRC